MKTTFGPQLNLGDHFTTHTGRKRIYGVGEFGFFNKENRRYVGKVVTTKDERYLDGFQCSQIRQILEIEVVER
jgi:hypothetical protein